MAQSRETPSNAAARVAPSSGKETVSPFIGSWTYRSFVSDPILSTPTEKLLFGAGTMTLSVPAPDHLAGTLGGDGWQLVLTGGVTAGNPAAIRFQGKGKIEGEEWVYDYLGFLVPGLAQRRRASGPRSSGPSSEPRLTPTGRAGSPAGVVAQWIAVRQDGPGATGATRPQATESARSTPAAAASGPGARANAGEKSPAAVRRLQQLFIKQDEIERQREEAKKRRETAPGSAARRTPLSPGLATSVGPLRTNYQPRPSLNPLTHTSSGGRLDLILNLDYGVYAIGKDRVKLRTYNNNLVGPVLRLKAGDVLYITLVNSLPLNANPPKDHETNGHHDWNTTNLHFHGLHVPPQGPAGPDRAGKR